MDPREHHFFFAKQMIPMHAFRSTDKMFSELTGPQREASLMSLWQEASKSVSSPLPHEDKGRRPGGATTDVVKLDVAFAIKQGDLDVVVISMPPAVAVSEAIFLALIRGGGKARVFFYERCPGKDGTVSESEAVLAEMNPEGRVNYGSFSGDGLESFKEHLGKVLGISLSGLQSTLPPVAAGAGSRAGVDANGAPAPKSKLADALERVTFMRAMQTVLIWLIGVIRGEPVGGVARVIQSLFTVAIFILLLVWLQRIYNARRGRTKYSPQLALGAWFIPIGNVVMAPLILRDVWTVVRGPEGSGVILLCWLFWLAEIGLTVLHYVELPIVGDASLSHISVAVAVGAYGLLWHIFRSINKKA